MKVTSVNAALISGNAKDVVRFYEENFGFKVMHTIELGASVAPLSAMFCMESADGDHIDVIQNDSDAADASALRVNVDYFEEAFSAYEKLGFTVTYGPALIESSTSALITKNGAAPVLLMQHIRK